MPLRPAPPRPAARRRRSRRLIGWLLVVVLVGGGLGAWAWWNGSVGSVPVREHCTATAAGTMTQVDPEQAGNAAIIAGVAWDRGLPDRAVVIALATAQQESGLRNIDYGDRDSLGLFQQRPSQGWGTEAQVQDAVYAAGIFYDRLVQVPGWDSGRLTDVAQTVQRSGFPEAYQKHEAMAIDLTAALRAGSGELDCSPV